MRVAVATTSSLAASAARELAEAGGNAVDCALAASLLTMNTEPGVCALAGGAYVTVWQPGSEPQTIDGNVAVPGFGLKASQRGHGTERVTMAYGGGITTLIGAGSVGVPGSLAAVEMAWSRYGAMPWPALLKPSISAARNGFPLSKACHYYLGYSGDPVYGRSSEGHGALHDNGALKPAKSSIVVPGLADSLQRIADRGAKDLYKGELAAAIANHCRDREGMLTRDDLERYEAVARPALVSTLRGDEIATNPPPAVGGVVLSAMLSAYSTAKVQDWNADAVRQLVEVQKACLGFRKRELDLADDPTATGQRMLREASEGLWRNRWTSSSTVHTSAVDSNGLACAITASSGYGSGEMPAGTGLWLNNCLGELELNRRGLDAGPIGARLPSNMAPTVVRRRDAVMALGSPGADRITTALHQFLVHVVQRDEPLDTAIRQPRLHVDTSGETDRLLTEPGLPVPEDDLPVTELPALSMYFGGVGVASVDSDGNFDVAADPRRDGGIYLTPVA